MMGNGYPDGAWTAAILVLIFSVVCLGLSVLLACMLIANGAKTTYMTLVAIIISVSTLVSIIQQVYFAVNFKRIEQVELEVAKISLRLPSFVYLPLFSGWNLALYEIQLWCYDIISVLIFFWAVALAKGVYNIRIRRLEGHEGHIATATKIFAVAVPALLNGISFSRPLLRRPTAFLVITTGQQILSLGLAAILVTCTVFRYLRSRYLVAKVQSSESHTLSEVGHSSTTASAMRVDTVLLLRFTIGVVILCAYEVVSNLFAIEGKRKNAMLLQQTEPDLSVGAAYDEIVLTIPGVTGSLLVFLLFGTTKQFIKQYLQAFRSARLPWNRRPSAAPSGSGANDWVELGSRASTIRRQPSVGRSEVYDVERQATGAPEASGPALKIPGTRTRRFEEISTTQPLPNAPHR